ncbi:MAG: adenylate/guanylate cyclase domain-containing protein [Pseudomonadota bacterium]
MNGLLFIDDEEGVRRSIMRALKNEGYELFLASNGDEGIDILKHNSPKIEIAISDYKMPGRDGMSTLCHIGKTNPEIARVLLTGYATLDSAIQATNEGIDGFLTKPFDNIELRLKIREIILKKRLKQFVPETVYSQLKDIHNPLQPTRQEATILFADIRNFTRLSQTIPPDLLAQYLNERYFTTIGEIAFQHNGTIDKHIGDSIMVIYGAPVVGEDDPVRAVNSAIEMQKKMIEQNNLFLAGSGIEIGIGIGICTGEVMTGVFGSARKKEYTALGTAVNIAARLEKLAPKGDILVSEKTYNKIKEAVQLDPLPPMIIKGFSEPIKIFRVR